MANDKEEKDDAEGKGGGKKQLIIILVPVLLLLAGAGWFFFIKSDESGVPEALPHPTPGAAVTLDPITINLAGAHFLKFGMALQPIASAHEIDGAQALDLAINQFSQMTIEELSTAKGRSEAKKELVARIKLTYLPHGTVLADVATLPESDSDSDSEKDSGSEHEEESDHKEGAESSEEEGHEEIHIEELTAAEVIEMADSLTVQPEVYDIYFTEFVMQ
jgi:flagellar protein FliL